jgi:hypothetical protein
VGNALCSCFDACAVEGVRFLALSTDLGAL